MAFDHSNYTQLEEHLGEARRVAVVTHINPDGDGVGAGIALSRFLVARDLDARMITSSKLPVSLQFLDVHHPTIPYNAATCSAFLREADLIFTVDNSSVSRLGPLEADVRAAQGTKICIDHHLVRNDFWNINIIDENACATGEMIYDLIKTLGGEVDRAMAEALYVSIMTDTGRFRFPKTNGRIHRIAAEFLELGVLPHRVHHEVHERNSPAYIRLMGEALLKIQFTAGGRLCWVELPSTLIDACDAHEEDTSEVIGQMLSIDGVEIGLLFRGGPDGHTKISLRSRPEHDVNALARANGGGGHRNAAGAVVHEPLERCASRVVADAASMLG